VRRYVHGRIGSGSLRVLWWGAEGPYLLEYVAIPLQISAIFLIASLEIAIPFRRIWGDIRRVCLDARNELAERRRRLGQPCSSENVARIS
jgi:hypothetical protein